MGRQVLPLPRVRRRDRNIRWCQGPRVRQNLSESALRGANLWMLYAFGYRRLSESAVQGGRRSPGWFWWRDRPPCALPRSTSPRDPTFLLLGGCESGGRPPLQTVRGLRVRWCRVILSASPCLVDEMIDQPQNNVVRIRPAGEDCITVEPTVPLNGHVSIFFEEAPETG